MEIKTERDLVIELRDARAEEEKLENSLSDAKARTLNAEIAIIELMESQDKTATARYDGIGNVILKKPRLYASFDKANEPLLFQFLKDEQREDLIKPTVNSASLSSYVRERMESAEAIPEFIKFYMKASIAFMAAK